jgi:exosortase
LSQLKSTLFVFGALWCLLVANLSQYWRCEPEYSFGWFVPIFCAYLFLIRWRSRPPAESQVSRLATWIFCVAGFALLPTWVIGQANSDWRLISWFLAGETVALSLCAIYFVGGTPWLRHFGFSICLILTAVPWLTFMEKASVRGLTEASTAITVALLNLFQIPASQHGNVVELTTGLVGIDEACSGIRSLQAAIMISLFLGELYRTSVLKRSVLVLGGAMIAFGCNAVRAASLATVGAKMGIEAIANWHDPLGYAILAASFLLIWGVARLISGPLPVPTPVVQSVPDIPISKAEADLLAFDEGRGAAWVNEDGTRWAAYFFRWAQGPGWSRILARAHRPEECFPGAGYKLCADHGLINVQARGVSIPFHAMDFDDGINKEYVFFCLWEGGFNNSQSYQVPEKWSQLLRLQSVLEGQRGLAQQTLEIVLSGYDSPEAAEAAFRREITTLIDARPNGLIANVSRR